ncbi:MAG: T9SS type A sorting domain-containing protein, partial [Bacteroidia bacterium]
IGPWNGWLGGNMNLVCFELNGLPIYPSTNCATNSVNEINSVADISIFPIPADKSISINFNSELYQCYSINILNYLGTIVYSESSTLGQGEIQEVSTENLPNGLYSISIVNSDGINLHRSIIIFH